MATPGRELPGPQLLAAAAVSGHLHRQHLGVVVELAEVGLGGLGDDTAVGVGVSQSQLLHSRQGRLQLDLATQYLGLL